MPHYQYDVVSATVTKDLGVHREGQRLLVCDIQCEDEHGHLLEIEKDVLVVVEDGSAEFVQYPENVLPEDNNTDQWDKLWLECKTYCDNHPGYSANNPVAFAELLPK